jgi:hypothetical protein
VTTTSIRAPPPRSATPTVARRQIVTEEFGPGRVHLLFFDMSVTKIETLLSSAMVPPWAQNDRSPK